MADTLRVLYVDDEPGLLDIGKLFLEKSGDFTVTTARSASEALRLLEQEQFDTIISDYQMPGLDGIQFLVEVRKRFGTVPFILFTGKGREEVVIQAINSGADFYLQKGGNPQAQFAELSHKIRQAASRKRAEEDIVKKNEELTANEGKLRQNYEELARSQSSLQESEEKYQVIVDHALEAIMIIDSSANVLFANPAAATLVDIENSSACIGKNALEIIAPESREAALADFTLTMEGRDGYLAQYKIITATARERWVELIGKKISFGGVPAVIVMFRDITERKRADEALNESERRFRELSDLLPQTVYETDANGILTYANDIAFEWFGYTEDEFKKGLNVLQMIAPHDRERAGAAFRAIIEGTGRTRVSDEYQALQKDGGTFPISIFASPVIVHGRINGLRGIIIDNTEQKRVEEALRDSKNRFSNLVAQSPLSIQILDISGKTILVNRAFEDLWEVPAEQVLGYNLLLDDQSKDTGLNSYLEKAFSGNSVVCPPIEFTPKTESVLGRTRVVQAFIYPIKDESGAIREVTLIHLDITDRKQAEELLRYQNEMRQTILDNIPVMVAFFDCEGQYQWINRCWHSTLGWSLEEMLQHKDVFAEFYPDPVYRKYVMDYITSAAGAGLWSDFKTRIRDGHVLDTSWINVPLSDGSIIGIGIDITERKRAADALDKVNQKLNVLSQLTRKDLTNQTFVLSSYLELAKNQLTGQDHVIATLKKGDHAIQLIHETIEYSKDYQDMGAKPPKWQNMKMALLLGLSHVSIGNIRHSIETENLEIFADPLLEKVCQRLFENSVKHGGHVTRIRVWHTVTPEGARIFFEDNGIGISEEMKEQIFLRSEGTGRASMRSLIFVREILDITGITITETGEPGKGARFEMMVPKGIWRVTREGAGGFKHE